MDNPDPETLDNAPEAIRRAVRQLSFAYSRSEETLSATQAERMADGMRRAESVLFAAGTPLGAEAIAEILPQGIEAADVLMALQGQYANRGVQLVEVAGKWQFQTAADLDYLFVETRQEQKTLSQAALETLAIIAYGQPVTRAEIEAVRGVAVSKGTLDTLIETGWVRPKGRRKTPGRPVTFGTTEAFLVHFGLESLAVLPGKADLEAEGLLGDVIPDDFNPLAEAESGLEAAAEPTEAPDLHDENADVGFVTDYLATGTDDA